MIVLVSVLVLLATMIVLFCSRRIDQNRHRNSAFDQTNRNVLIIYGTLTGSTKSLVKICEKAMIDDQSFKVEVRRGIDTKLCGELIEFLGQQTALIVFVPTYVDGLTSPDIAGFVNELVDLSNDHRVDASTFAGLKVAIYGLGDKSYGPKQFNKAAKIVNRALRSLGAKVLVRPVYCDMGNGDQSVDLVREMTRKFVSRLSFDSELKSISDDSDDDVDESVDIEDLMSTAGSGENQMANRVIRQNLTKQRYRIIGGHSAVKLCRWTKSMVRNRGGCYKHTFYGINSHQCMEMTPSLACANKCVFCWRHNTNPVGTSWRWDVDDPQTIVDQAFAEHYKLIRELKGIKDVQMESFQDASGRIRHCALSLVGEPIMYPHINRLIELLHQRGVSTFLVTNGQFPDCLRSLKVPVTQLYTSIDASTKEEIAAVDRPLFSDYWSRLIECLEISSQKAYRTVCRLTLIKGSNMDNIEGYRNLVSIAKPDFVEIKGVTYSGCGGSEIGMKDVPWHDEVVEFAENLLNSLNEPVARYGLASEHEHSNCVLLANLDFYLGEGRWKTWIDYDRFNELALRSDQEPFTALDYSVEAPSWAVYGAQSRGFDPIQKRFYRRKK